MRKNCANVLTRTEHVFLVLHNKFTVKRVFFVRLTPKSAQTFPRKSAPPVDCSQSPYFSVGFSRLVRFDGAAAILVCKSERDLGRVSKLPRGGERGCETLPLPSEA